jgi:putative flavoprotein involved in K+ transport
MAHTETIVVGGGQAGLSASWHLTQAGLEHLVLDRGQIGDSWRRRWDSFCLVTPNRFCLLPGFPYDGDDPGGFMLRDEIVDYVDRFAASFGPPYRLGVEVSRVAASAGAGRFALETSAGAYTADNLIIAAGTHQHPKVPAIAEVMPSSITRLHTQDYRNPGQLPGGAVLIVGSGQSGCQVAEDLLADGRSVHLCVGDAGRVPRRYRGRDIIEWEDMSGWLDKPVGEHPLGTAVRFKAHPHLSGRDGGHTINLRQLALDGVRLHGRLQTIEGTTLHFADDLAVTLDAIDAKCLDELKNIDTFIAENGIEAPPDDSLHVEWQPGDISLELDMERAGIGCVIFATGYRFDFSWIDLPIFDERGYPRYQRGVTDIPGLYFVGLHWLHSQGSGLFSRVGRDAGYVIDHLRQAGRRTGLGRVPGRF